MNVQRPIIAILTQKLVSITNLRRVNEKVDEILMKHYFTIKNFLKCQLLFRRHAGVVEFS